MKTKDKKDENPHRDKCGKCTNCKCLNNEKFDAAELNSNYEENSKPTLSISTALIPPEKSNQV